MTDLYLLWTFINHKSPRPSFPTHSSQIPAETACSARIEAAGHLHELIGAHS